MEITLKEVSFSYNAGTPLQNDVLEEITLALGSNKTIAVVGRTGSGKSTFVQLLNGLLQPTRGSIDLGDIQIVHNSKKLPILYDKVGMVFQFPEHQLFEDTVIKDISFGPRNLGWTAEVIRSKSLEAMKLVGLDESFCDRSPFELSGGEKRRVAIAGVLTMDPTILILDEPTVGLDSEGKHSLMSLFHAWQKEKERTVIIVTHDMDIVAEYADEVIVFERGEIHLKTEPLTLFTQYRSELNAMGLKLPMALQLVEALNTRWSKSIELKSVKKELIIQQIADRFLRRES